MREHLHDQYYLEVNSDDFISVVKQLNNESFKLCATLRFGSNNIHTNVNHRCCGFYDIGSFYSAIEKAYDFLKNKIDSESGKKLHNGWSIKIVEKTDHKIVGDLFKNGDPYGRISIFKVGTVEFDLSVNQLIEIDSTIIDKVFSYLRSELN